MDTSSQKSRALQLRIADAAYVAIAPYELVELIEHPATLVVPFAPPYCAEMLVWEGQAVAVFDLRALVRYVHPESFQASQTNDAPPLAALLPHVLIAAYQTAAATSLRYVGLRVAGVPQTVVVNDVDHAPLPLPAWVPITAACFNDGLDVVPIIDVQRLAQLAASEIEALAQATQSTQLASPAQSDAVDWVLE